MSEIKLLLCPFCGGEARVVENNFRTDTYSVRCKNCYAESDRYHTQEEAIKQWNKRKPMERIIERIESFPHGDFNVETMEQLIEIVKEEGGIE